MDIEQVKQVFNCLYAVQRAVEKDKKTAKLATLIAKHIGEPDFCKTLEDIYPIWKKYSQTNVMSEEFFEGVQTEAQTVWKKHKQSQLSFELCNFMLEEFGKEADKLRKQITDYAIERSERTGIEIETKYFLNFKSKEDVDIFLAGRRKNEMS